MPKIRNMEYIDANGRLRIAHSPAPSNPNEAARHDEERAPLIPAESKPGETGSGHEEDSSLSALKGIR